MTKKLHLFITMLLCAVFGVAQAQQVSLDFSTNDWGLPEGSANKLTESKPYTNSDGYTVTLQAADGYYFNTQGYLMLGKAGSTLTLPAFTFKVSKIAVVGNSGASASVKQNIFVGEEAVSTETEGAKGTNEYVIASDKRAIGTIYTLKVLSAHNTQITQIKIYKEGDEGLSAPNLSFGSTTSFTVELGKEFTAPELTYAEGFDGTVTYSSDNTDAVEVNANTGAVTINAVGTAKITATSEATTKFEAGSASYTIKVVEPQGQGEVVDGTFDFTGTTDYGSGLAPSADDITDDHTWTAGNVTLVTSGKYRWWYNASGNTLRFYNNLVDEVQTSRMTISVPSGYEITKIEITGGRQFKSDDDNYDASKGVWSGNAQSVVLRYAASSGNVAVKTVTVTYSQGGDNPPSGDVYNSIAEIKQLEPKASGKLKFNNIQVLYVNGKDMYAKDNTGAIDFYFEKTDNFNYTAGQKLNGTATVTYDVYNEMPEITKVEDANLTATSGTVTPVTISAAVNLPDYICQLVKVTGKFKKDGNNVYITDGTNDIQIYNKWKLSDIDLGQVVEGSEGTATGIVVTYKSNNVINHEIALTALEYESAGLIDPQLSFDPAGPFEITQGDEFTEPTLSAAPDFDFGIVKYTSTNTYVAKVDEATGKLEIIGTGTTTIKATSEANEEFLAGSASYQLTVNRPPAQPGTDKFEYVTDASSLVAGDVIILVGTNTVEETVTTYAMSEQSGNFRITEVVTPESDGTIIPNNYVQLITLEGAADAWYLKVGDNQYLYACSSSSNYMKTDTKEVAGDNAKAKITIEEAAISEGSEETELQTTILFQGENTRNDIRFNYNSGSTPRFSCYTHKTTQMPRVKIYRKVKSGTLLGDANNDGKINISDVTAIINYMLGHNPTPFNTENANVNKDEYINIKDVTEIINILLQ